MSLGTPALNQGSNSTQNVNITQINGGAISLGQKTMANSFPVVIASDQSAISVSQSGNWTARIVGNIGGILDAVIGAAIPANAIFVGANKSGNLSYLNLDSSNNLMVNVSNFAIGTFGNSDGTAANLTSGLAFSEGLLYNGTSWDRWRGDTTNGAWVNVKNTPTVTANAGTGTFNIQSNASVNINQVGGSAVSTAATGIQKVGITGNTGAAMDAAGQNAASPANELLIGGQFNTTPTTITSGNMSPLQVDSGGKLLVNVGATISSLPGVNINAGSNIIGALTANQSVNVAQINGSTVSTAATGVQKVGIVGNAGASIDATVGAGTAPTNMVAVGGLYNSTEISPTTGQSAALQLDSKGRVRMVLMDAAANTRGQNVNANNAAGVYIDQTTIGTTNGVTPVPAANSGWSFSYQSALTNSVVQIKGTAATFGGYINLFNPNTATTYIQVFNKTSANVTLGVTAPDFVVTLPGIASASGTGSDRNLEMTHGIALSTAYSVAATTTASGSTAPTNAVVTTLLYK